MTEPTIARRTIYRDVYHKRVDTRATTASADGIGRARLVDGALVFDGGDAEFAAALSDGVFYLRIPPGCDLAAGDECADTFHRGPGHPPYGGLRTIGPETFGDPLLGFHERTNQIEQFLLERRFWARYYPPRIAALGEDLTGLARQVVRSVLARVGVPPALRERATGGCSEAAGSYHLTFNHYRPAVAEVGLSSHKDDGFVTVLRATSPGLEVNRSDRWESVVPDPDHLVVNFGLSMQLLTSRCATPVAAIMHRVTHQSRDRSTFGHFSSSRCDHERDAGIFRYDPAAADLVRVCGARELIDLNDHEIYEGTDGTGEEHR